MYNISALKLFQDTKDLRKEYLSESEEKYKQMYSKYFPDDQHQIVLSKPIQLHNPDIPITIEIDRYSKAITSFGFQTDGLPDVITLRQNPTVRKLTKLCFYIEDNIGPYNTTDNDLKELNDKLQ